MAKTKVNLTREQKKDIKARAKARYKRVRKDPTKTFMEAWFEYESERKFYDYPVNSFVSDLMSVLINIWMITPFGISELYRTSKAFADEASGLNDLMKDIEFEKNHSDQEILEYYALKDAEKEAARLKKEKEADEFDVQCELSGYYDRHPKFRPADFYDKHPELKK